MKPCNLPTLDQLLKEAAATKEQADKNSRLRTQAANGYIEGARALLQDGADVHVEDDEPLLWAASGAIPKSLGCCLKMVPMSTREKTNHRGWRWCTSTL